MIKVSKLIIFSVFFVSIALGSKIAVATKVKGLVEIMPIGKTEFFDLKTVYIIDEIPIFCLIKR